MGLQIIKGNEPIKVERPVFAVYGQPGIGKTSLGFSAPKPLLLDFDSGSHRAVNRRDVLRINSWDDITELMASPDLLDQYNTLVVDTVGRCLDIMSADILESDPKLGRQGNLSQQGWGILKSRFRLWITALRAKGKYVLLLAHDREDKDGDARVVRPDIAGGSYSEVLKVADFVGYLYMSGKARILDFSPSDRWVAKNPGQWKPETLPAPERAGKFMEDLFIKGSDALGKISAEQAEATNLVDDWRAAIETFETAQDFTDALAQINTLKPMTVLTAVKKLLKTAADKKQFTYDAQTKAFVAAQPVGGS